MVETAHCENCGCEQPANHTCRVISYPEHLILQLQRFLYDRVTHEPSGKVCPFSPVALVAAQVDERAGLLHLHVLLIRSDRQ